VENRWLLYFHSIFGFVFLKENGHKAYVTWWWHHCDVIKLAINLEQANSTHVAYGQCASTCLSAFLACVWRESAGNYTQSLLWVGQGTAGAASTVVWEVVAPLLAMESSPAEPRRGPRSLGWPKEEHWKNENPTACTGSETATKLQTACTGVAGLILLGRAQIEGEMSSSPTWIAMAGNERGRWRACRGGSGQQFPCGVRQPWEGGWEHENGREFHLPISYCKAKTGDSLWTVPGQRMGTSVAVGWPRARRDLEGECRGELGLTAARRWETDARRVPLLYIGRADLEITSNLAKNGVGGDLFPSSRESWLETTGDVCRKYLKKSLEMVALSTQPGREPTRSRWPLNRIFSFFITHNLR
jgi:hypothetical protein